MKTPLFILFAILTFSCSSEKSQQKASSQFLEISFGSGGGFTGAGSTYLLKADRQVFKMKEGEFIKINTISKAELRSISSTLKDIDFLNLNFSEKGNMTYFIEIKSADTTHKVTWTDTSLTPELKEFYKTLAGTLKQK